MILGIDPGKSGAAILLSPDGEIHPQSLCGLDSAHAFNHWLKYGSLWSLIDFIYIEKAQAMPKNGAVSMFNYGQGFGEIIGIVTALQIPYELVPPAKWTKEMLAGVPAGIEGKERARIACERLFPEANLLATPRCKKPHEGLVDALLIAEWGRRKTYGNTK